MKSKGPWKEMVLFAISCISAIAVGEIVVAGWYPQNLGTWGMTRDGLTSHVPNISVYVRQFGQQISINSHGMRDREHQLEKPPGIYRILLLGDSFMEANQVAFEDAFPHLLETKLGPRFEVINASVSGWGTDDELTYLIRYGFRFEPDLVLLGMTLNNDIQDNLAEEFHSHVNGDLQEKPVREIPPLEYAILQVKEFFASRSHLYQLLLRAKRSSWMQHEGERLSGHVASLLSQEPSQELVRGWDMSRQLLRKMKIESERHGARFFVFLIPLSIQVSDDELKTFLDMHQISFSHIVLDQPQMKMKQIGITEGFDTIDLLPEFNRKAKAISDSLYVAGDGHWTVLGHRIAADTVIRQLLLSGILPPYIMSRVF